MRTVTDLITAARNASRNGANPDGTYSIPDSEIIQYLNDAQDRMQNKISSSKNIAKVFVTEAILNVTQNQANYTVPDRVLLNKQIEWVEFSADGALGNYIRLEKLHFFNRDTNTTTYPHGYFKRGNQILLQPTPSTTQGTLRVMYEREVDDLVIPTDLVVAVYPGAYTAKEIGVQTGSSSFATNVFICISDAYGNIMLRNGLIASYNGGLKKITLVNDVSTYLQGAYTLADLANGYVNIGKYVTNISQLPDDCERYLIHYTVAELFHRDSSNDYSKQLVLVGDIEKDIIDALKTQSAELQYIPQIDRWEWW
jgi:hypothetical protein